MHIAEKTIVSPCNLFNRNAHRFTYKISYLPSNVKITTLDNPPVNAKSILGLLSAVIQEGTMIRIACYNENKEIAEHNLESVINALNELVVGEDGE